jgi:hypothetical protein
VTSRFLLGACLLVSCRHGNPQKRNPELEDPGGLLTPVARVHEVVACSRRDGGTAANEHVETREPNAGNIAARDVDPNEILLVVRENMPGLRSCYEAALGGRPPFATKVLVEWTIERDGTVKNVCFVDPADRPNDFLGCLSTRISTWRFSTDGVSPTDVSFPFAFDTVPPR